MGFFLQTKKENIDLGKNAALKSLCSENTATGLTHFQAAVVAGDE